MNTECEFRVLSIQSQVVSGYVGNKSATFPLQLLGFDVDIINTVQLSNHTGYEVTKGDIYSDVNLQKLIDGLIANDLHYYSHLLTGYVGSISFLQEIVKLIPILKEKNPQLIFLCDPVMGDNGKLYVPEELVEIYKEEIVPLSDILIPNQFELELLTHLKIKTLNDAKVAIEKLHRQGPKIIVVSSIEIEDKLMTIVSNSVDKKIIKIDIPKIKMVYTGSGDLFASLFLAHYTLQNDLKTSLEHTINSLYSILLKTFEYASVFKDPNAQEVRKKELRLIQSKKIIENPPTILKAEILS